MDIKDIRFSSYKRQDKRDGHELSYIAEIGEKKLFMHIRIKYMDKPPYRKVKTSYSYGGVRYTEDKLQKTLRNI